MAKTIETPVGNAPLIPVMLIMVGGYLAWYGVHYWRQDLKWPSDPLKSVLTGKGVPPSTAVPTVQAGLTSAVSAATAGTGGGGSGSGGTGNNSGGTTTGSAIADAALKYQGQGYTYGGPADKPGNWDCSSFVSYVLGHDLHQPLPGGHWGDPGFPPHAHGPTTGSYLVFGSPINRGQVQAGDLIVWNSHMAIATSNSQAISAHDPLIGTTVVGLDGENAAHGGGAQFRRVA